MAASAPLAQEEPQSAGKHLRNQLAAAVRSINWSYAIFWSISSSHSGSLTWKDGFYNGETKTRRITNSSPELTSNQLVMQRSEQLRELYESLLSGNCDHRAERPVISLSLEDLADGEWYYLVCMTYTFRPWQGFPGRCLASNDHVWLCNAHLADSETFLRALLAKSAAIQTIVCIPLMGGVLELGTTFSVPENTDLVNRVTASLKEPQYGTCTDAPSANLTGQADNAIVLLDDLDENGMETMIAEGQHETGEVDCLFNTNLEQITKETGDFYGLWEELDVQPLENSWIMDEGILSDSPRMTSFMAWTMPGSDELAVPVIREPQKLLKKVVSGGSWTNSGDVNTEIVERIAQESSIKNHVMSERRRRGKLNEMFLILKSLAPAINKMDKASILAGAIAYLKELEQKVQELESISRPAGKAMLMCHDNEITGMSLSAANKRKKASELSGDMEEREHHWELSKDGSSNVINVSIMGTDVVVQVQCRWKELLMARVFDAIKNLHLDVLSVQASTPDGLFGLKIKAQFSSSATFAPGIIREALQNAIN